ncbi:MAG: dockerin type I repeat-containing protein, partial [Acutalibacteraceae bacterium]
NITLVPDRIGESHGKVTATFNPETQKYTLTAVAEPGYVLASLAVSGCNEYVPLIADKTDVLTTVYTPYSFGYGEADGGDVYVSAGGGSSWSWPTVIADFVINDDPNLGDVNTDGDINILDIVKVKKYLVKAEGFEYEYFDMYNANIDDSDNVINSSDLAGLRQLLLEY